MQNDLTELNDEGKLGRRAKDFRLGATKVP